MKRLIIVLSIIIAIVPYVASQIEVFPNENICDKIKDAFENEDVVCLMRANPLNNWYLLRLHNCDDVVIGQDQELILPSLVQIQLSGNSDFTLTGNGKITGEHFQTTQIVIKDDKHDNAVINMELCNGCRVSDLTIRGDSLGVGSTGIDIGDNSNNNEMDAVKMQNIKNGMTVSGDNNLFTDLQFFAVAIDKNNCDASINDDSAIRLESSNSNSFTNVLHTRSHGAISFLLQGECDDNTIIGLSVEQEESHCAGGAKDPAVFIDDSMCSGNVFLTNYNGARTEVDNNIKSTICQNNTILDQSSEFANCEGASLVECPEN
ncbi:MAG: hypothetical protein HKN09_09360 [Saprospiraceae bacterium]|nr:hypothetical protein [Saprospiraceae bacterium]